MIRDLGSTVLFNLPVNFGLVEVIFPHLYQSDLKYPQITLITQIWTRNGLERGGR